VKPSRKDSRRTTITLPKESLSQAAKIARSKHVRVSTVIAEALADGLRMRRAGGRVDQILESYRQAFSGFTEEELMILDGILLENDPGA
jgi:hypothetical protein